jgi:predicted acylesterase/phospholipase RssA
LASCAIPGIYRPVRDGRRVLVDGGVLSSTNLDLAVDRAPQLVIVVAPMAFDTEDAPSPAEQITRRRAAVTLGREARAVRTMGHDVVTIRPWRKEIGMHGSNLMRLDTLTAVTTMAYDCATATLQSLGGAGIAGAAGAAGDAREVA